MADRSPRLTDCLIGLGSNLGPRERRIRRALAGLTRLPRTRLIAASSLYRTRAVGPPQPDYLNAAAWLRTGLRPVGLLVELKRLEARAGRRRGPRWGPRRLDLDLLFYGRLRVRTRLLSLPHPRALRRRFVLRPLSELRPSWRPPGSRITLAALERRLKAPSENVIMWSWSPCPRRRR